MRRAVSFLLVVGLAACSPLSLPRRDGGAGGGGGGGGAGGGGDSRDAGGLGSFQFSQVTISGSMSSGGIVGLGGAPDDLWAIQADGRLLHSSGGDFSTVFDFTGGGRHLYVSGSTVVVALLQALRVCQGTCRTEAAFSRFDLFPLGLDAYAVCGRGAAIWAVTENATYDGGLYRYTAGQWMSVAPLPIRYPRHCWVDDDDVLWVAGQGGVVRYDGVRTDYELVTPQEPTLLFYGGASVGGVTWAVGSAERVARRTAPGTWTVEQRPQVGTATWTAIGGVPGAMFAIGPVTQATVVRYLEWDGLAWTEHQTALPGVPTFGAGNVVHALSDRLIYFAGLNDTGPWIVRGTR